MTDALREMRRVARSMAVVSVPNQRIVYPVQLPIPKVGLRRWLLERCDPRGYEVGPEHQWEIGHGGISAGHVRAWMGEAGLRVERDWRPFENPTHHSFVLRKMS